MNVLFNDCDRGHGEKDKALSANILQDLQGEDPKVWQAIQDEEQRQRDTLELIASENFTSPAVREATGSCFTNKYAEGYPGKRYYGGCENADRVEDLAKERVQQLFQVSYSNVQPHSGSQANMAVYCGFLQPGDTVLGMDLSHGGHLTHGSKVNFSGQLYKSVFYGLHPDSQTIDYEQVRELARKHEPRLIIAGASAYPREIDFQIFRHIADEVGAYLLVDMAHIAGLVATGLHQSPMHVADFVTSTTHKSLRGPRGGFILSSTREYGKKINSQIFPGLQGGPLMHVIAAKAVAFGEALRPEFATYQRQVVANAKSLASSLADLGYKLVSGGTDNHLLLVDLREKNVSGKEAEDILDRVGITVNKNSVPRDQASPSVTSGMRLGTPLLTTRGMREEHMERIAQWMDRALQNKDNASELACLANEVKKFAAEFPLFLNSPKHLDRKMSQ
jgi:glycine hydroxymethyltransferase